MSYDLTIKTVADIDKAIRNGLERLPHDIGMVVGIPRSGMLPATLIAAYLNVPLSDFESFLKGSCFSNGERPMSELSSKDRVLIVDDSIHSGATMRRLMARVRDSKLPNPDIVTLAVFGVDQHYEECNIVLEQVSVPRIFSWNIAHSSVLAQACVDFDGVLCREPRQDENDDSKNYAHFIVNATPLYVPSTPIKYIVTGRLEKYRAQSEKWLESHGIKYEKLFMVNLESAQFRTKEFGFCHATHKARIFSQLNEAVVFLESEPWQAEVIARLSGKTAFAVKSGDVYYPSYKTKQIRRVRHALQNPRWAIKRLFEKIGT